jgi:transposase
MNESSTIVYQTGQKQVGWVGKEKEESKEQIQENRKVREAGIRFKSPEKDMYEITDILTEEGYNISARSVARVLSEHGVTLKKRGRKLEFYTSGEKRFE